LVIIYKKGNKLKKRRNKMFGPIIEEFLSFWSYFLENGEIAKRKKQIEISDKEDEKNNENNKEE